MPFPMKIQPIDSEAFRDSTSIRNDTVAKPVLKSRLKRLFDRPFTTVLRISSEKPNGGVTAISTAIAGGGGLKDVDYFEPSSVCLDKMVQNFIEENNNNEKPISAMAAAKCGRNRCNCFNGKSNDSSDDEFDFAYGFADSNNSSFTDSIDTLKSLIPCASTAERNLLADTSQIVERNKACKRKHDLRKIVSDELIALGYDASICKSKWDKSSSIPAGDYEYIDVIVDGQRILVDVDFRSEFEIARSTGSYKTVLQSLPFIFVGKADRLSQIISIVSEAARLSLKKKGMHIAPWRKAEYIKSKWLSPFTRISPPTPKNEALETPKGAINGKEIGVQNDVVEVEKKESSVATDGGVYEGGELELIFGEKALSFEDNNSIVPPEEISGEEEKLDFSVRTPWQPPPLMTSEKRKNKVIVTGLASLLKEKP